jgi:hypothetical protein
MKHFIGYCFLLLLTLDHCNLLAQIKNIWALGDGEKVFRDDLSHPAKNGNYTWDGNTIHLNGLFNEVLAFQVIVETGNDSAKGIEISVDPLNDKTSRKIIGGSTLKYGPEGTIEIFTEHYLHVKDSTRPNWYYGSPAAAPKKMTGWIPDALIPANAMSGGGGFPVSIGPSENQGFWVDVSLPRDQKNFPAGKYFSRVQVLQNGKVIKEIPLEITLFPFYLPDENHANIWVFSSDVYSYFPGLSKKQVDDMLKFEAHRHRIDLAGGFEVNDIPFDPAKMNGYKPYLDGSAFTPLNGYHGNGEGVGEKIFPIGMYGSPVLGSTKEMVQQQSNLWVDWFNKNAPSVKYFWYMTDEPGEEKYAWIKEHANWLKSNNGSGKSLPTFTTTAYKKDLGRI